MLPSKRTSFSPSQCYRSVLEVLKWLPSPDILLRVQLVNTNWRKLCHSSELWITMIGRDIERVDLKSTYDYINLVEAYRAIYIRKNYLYYWKYKVNTLQAYNPDSGVTKTLPRSNYDNIECSSSFLSLNDGRILVCGGRGGAILGVVMYFRSVFIIDTYYGDVKQYSDMLERKAGMELLELKGLVYSFGGHNMRKSKTIERAETATLQWEKHGELNRTEEVLCVCTYRDFIFIGGTPSQILERYNPYNHTFACLAIIPFQLYKGISFMQGETFHIVTDCRTCLVMNLKDLEFHSQKIDCDYNIDLSYHGMKRRKEVYFVSHDAGSESNGIFKLEVDKFRIQCCQMLSN